MTIPEFIQRCDAYCAAAEVTRTWLSKRLFNDTYRIKDLADGESDIGIMRMERAEHELVGLEADLTFLRTREADCCRSLSSPKSSTPAARP